MWLVLVPGAQAIRLGLSPTTDGGDLGTHFIFLNLSLEIGPTTFTLSPC